MLTQRYGIGSHETSLDDVDFGAGFGLVAVAFLAAAQDLPPRLFFQVATGPTAGTSFPMGELIAGIVSHPPGCGALRGARRMRAVRLDRVGEHQRGRRRQCAGGR